MQEEVPLPEESEAQQARIRVGLYHLGAACMHSDGLVRHLGNGDGCESRMREDFRHYGRNPLEMPGDYDVASRDGMLHDD